MSSHQIYLMCQANVHPIEIAIKFDIPINKVNKTMKEGITQLLKEVNQNIKKTNTLLSSLENHKQKLEYQLKKLNE